MHRLLPGICEFSESIFPAHRDQFEKLASGQQPTSLFITCSDSRIVPELLTQTSPGELFVLRNAGNLVTPCSPAPSGEGATIEYALRVLRVEEMIVCGHSHCGAIGGLLRPQAIVGLPHVEKWLSYAERIWDEIADQRLITDGDDDILTAAIKANVLVQIQHLRTYPAVAAAEAEGQLHLHGYFYRFETGEVTVLDEPGRRFVPIASIVDTRAMAGRV
ncbi:MAG TPA: carbonic anhydrase [Lacipirellulaceae bacterium]|jgi:carbonic anhydrase|nr:carbonic anhydrase [Lacipirellulaceae bacterium]